MKPLYTQLEFDSAKSQTKLLLECYYCANTFTFRKKDIVETFNSNLKKTGEFCSRKCKCLYNGQTIKTKCLNCNKEMFKSLSQFKKHQNSFCSQSCSASYNNRNKTTGTRRSKLEIWLEEQLTILYPNLPIEFNKKGAINSELDIYIPSLNLAFELNGIFHYEPIYGINKLNQIQSNDISKSKACHDAKIDLCIIDTSAQIYVKPSTSQKYLDIINDIIKERLLIT
jgi:hypothetical protein